MTVRLAVAGAFHTDFMAPAREKLQEALAGTAIQVRGREAGWGRVQFSMCQCWQVCEGGRRSHRAGPLTHQTAFRLD